MKHFISAAFVFGLTATSALAGNVEPPADPIVAPPPPVSADWAGPYVGVQLGFADFDLDAVLPPPAGAATPTIINLSDDGFLYGLHAGYNWDRGTLVYGVEADVDFMDVSFGATDIDNIARLRLRLGVDANRAFIYGTAGAAHLSGSGGPVSISGWGWVAGAGVDFRVSQDWLVGADVLYHEFDDVSPSGSVEGTTFRLRASYEF
ncbi:MAG: outer membrane beta-barrel protein [Pseudomonadota bacterium]